jgi:hypothetical protein
MHRKLLVLSLVFATAIVLLTPAMATAFQWHMRYGQAKHESRRYASRTCSELSECEAFGVGQCYRRSESRFDCTIGFFFPGPEYIEEIECNEILHWGVDYNGYVRLKNSGEPQCFTR